jgi:hypothetical protein
MSDEPLRYRHRQIGHLTLVGLVGGGLSQIGAAARDLRSGRKRVWSYLPGSLVFLSSMAVFSSLTAEVTDDAVSARFTGGLFRRRVPLADVTEAVVVTLPWYVGWGLRYWSGGWLYCVSGRRAVRLSVAGARSFTIGSDEPELLQMAIEDGRAAIA